MVNLKKDVWDVADTLRGVYARADVGNIILPMTILRRLECVLAPHRDEISQIIKQHNNEMVRTALIEAKAGVRFYNTTLHTLTSVYDSKADMADNLLEYIRGFSADIDVFTHFNLAHHIDRMNKAGVLAPVVRKFRDLDLSLKAVPNAQMGDLFEHLIYMDFESSNAESGDFYTPRDAIQLLVDLVFAEDDDALTGAVTREIYDPTVGTGGMLSVAEEHLKQMNPDAELILYGQERRPESYALCRSDLLAKGQDSKNIALGDTLVRDQFPDKVFDYILANPPYGVDWKNQASKVTAEHKRGDDGRFGPGLPPTSDGALLFVLHAISKMRPAVNGGARVGIVLNSSPLFSGGAGSGASDIRGHLLNSDLLEAIVALPNDMFYNTGLGTYLWIFHNSKSRERRGKVHLIDATGLGSKMRKGLGAKRIEIDQSARKQVLERYTSRKTSDTSKIFDNLDFAYWQITVDRPLRLNFSCAPERVALVAEHPALGEIDGLIDALPSFGGKLYTNREEFMAGLVMHLDSNNIRLNSTQRKTLWQTLGERDESADICRVPSGKKKGQIEPDIGLRDTEVVPFGWGGHSKTHEAERETIDAYFAAEIKPHVDDAWIDYSKTKTGYEIPFTRHFYEYFPPRTLNKIDADLDESIQEILGLLRTVEANK